jgi:uncharacterized protein YcnI
MRITLLAAAAAALILPAAAGAHVTVQPPEATAGAFTVLDVRVPNERDDAGTTKVEVQFPDGFASVSYQAVPGWKVKVQRETAPEPIDLHGEQITEQIDTVTFTGSGKTGIVGPGQFIDFPLSVRVPEGEAGAALTFKALQTYDDGEIVRWIGAPDADKPAPAVTLVAAGPEHGAADRAGDEAQEEAAGGNSDSGEGALVYVALALGAAGLALGAAAFARSRRPAPA